jgi:hypothetical protein
MRHLMYYRGIIALCDSACVSASGPPYFPEGLFSSTTVPRV